MQDDGKRAVKGSGSVDRFVNGPIRYASVDALRGIAVAAMLLVNNPGDWAHVYRPLRHADWHGCTPTDLIFPLFLFVVGVSIALGLVSRLEGGADRVRLQRSAYVRAAQILGLGLLLHALAFWSLDKALFRPWGVLQRIGLCFLLAAGAALYMRPRAQWWLIAALLLGYWVLLDSVAVTRHSRTFASRMDAWLLGPMNYQFDPATGRGHDPEGLLSTLGALATTLLGLRAGDWLRHGRTGALMLAGVAALALGYVWSLWLPLNKNLWTPSYALWTAGWAALALWLAHLLVDRRGFRALAPLRRQRDCRLCRFRGHGLRAGRTRLVGTRVPCGFRRLDDASLRALPALAGFRGGLRKRLVAGRLVDGPAWLVSEGVARFAGRGRPRSASQGALRASSRARDRGTDRARLPSTRTKRR